MATTLDPGAQHLAATQLADPDFTDQCAARELSKMAEAVANVFMVVFYQAETGRATTRLDFSEAMATVRETLQRH
ncbi:type I toxin-antitoxin system ptaRNA1 family toxin [Burkholderia ambifaria]|uniref:type I toxin-antitoxin system ptaRNA1 family toxin n=1 Tax=Burkholderia ambifaria TaxID=152480 RepID=UPI00158E08F9|nr:type I toxin-antitoxin system ptaRNA1 family toxin [Burkholderia ambifaria]